MPGQLERPPRAGGQHGDPLDRDDAAGELVEHRSRVPGAGADVEHALPALELEELAHRRDDERLGDRLVLADRERRIVVRVRGDLDRDERLARDAPHRGQHALVGDPTATELSLDHAGSEPAPVRLAPADHAARRAAYAGTPTPKCASTAGATSTTLVGVAIPSMPTAMTGTSESPATSDPCEPPPR